MNSKKNKELLDKGLQELHAQLERGDKATIARQLAMDEHTVAKYLKGEGPYTDFGKKILTAGRKLIMNRQVA